MAAQDWVGPQAFAGSPGELFDHLEAGIAGGRSLPPGRPFFQQLAPHIAPVMQQDLGRHPALLVSREASHDHVAISDVGCHRELRLFPVGLLEFRGIDVFKMDRFAAAVVTNSQSIALMDW